MNDDYYHNLAQKRGLKWQGETVPRNTKEKTTWECQFGHRWLAKAGNIQGGSGCPECAQEKRRQARPTSRPWTDTDEPAPNQKLSEAVYHQAGQTAGFEWLGPLPENTKQPTGWRCKQGHTWKAPYTNIVFSHSECPECALALIRNDDAKYRQVGLRFSLNYVGPLPQSTRQPTWWTCQVGHYFKKRLASIQCGEGCPTCFKLTYAKHRGTGAHAALDCKGAQFTYETLIEAQAQKNYLDEVGCSPNCQGEHPIIRI